GSRDGRVDLCECIVLIGVLVQHRRGSTHWVRGHAADASPSARTGPRMLRAAGRLARMTRRFAVWIFLVILFVAIIAGAARSADAGSGFEAGALTRDGVSYGGTTVQSGSSSQ